MNELSVWAIFWVGFFTYKTIKAIAYYMTYNKNTAIKELAQEKFNKEVDELVEMKKEKLFKLASKYCNMGDDE